MGFYTKKPVTIEAVQWTGNNIEEITQFIDFDALPESDLYVGKGIGHIPATGELEIPTLEGMMVARPGDFIIRGVQGEVYPCKPDIFEATYEPALEISEVLENLGVNA